MKTLASLVCLLLVGNAFAWNIICGISIGYVNDPFAIVSLPTDLGDPKIDHIVERVRSDQITITRTKWEADAAVIRSMGNIYLAVAELQTLPLEELDIDPAAVDFSPAIEASNLFSEAQSYLITAQHLTRVLEEHESPFPDYVIDNLRRIEQMMSILRELKETLDSGMLPSVHQLQELLIVTSDYTASGMEIAVMHIGEQHPGHIEGGIEFPLPEGAY